MTRDAYTAPFQPQPEPRAAYLRETAAGSAGIMDKLVVSHQKFGGSVDASEAALSAMAPAMQAANMSVDDGVALLNLFNASGLDASKASAMLAKAVKQLAPGQDLNDLIAQIGAIEKSARLVIPGLMALARPIPALAPKISIAFWPRRVGSDATPQLTQAGAYN